MEALSPNYLKGVASRAFAHHIAGRCTRATVYLDKDGVVAEKFESKEPDRYGFVIFPDHCDLGKPLAAATVPADYKATEVDNMQIETALIRSHQIRQQREREDEHWYRTLSEDQSVRLEEAAHGMARAFFSRPEKKKFSSCRVVPIVDGDDADTNVSILAETWVECPQNGRRHSSHEFISAVIRLGWMAESYNEHPGCKNNRGDDFIVVLDFELRVCAMLLLDNTVRIAT